MAGARAGGFKSNTHIDPEHYVVAALPKEEVEEAFLLLLLLPLAEPTA